MNTARNSARSTHHLEDIRFFDCHLVSPAPEVFQKQNEDAFGDIPDVHIVFDDLIIAASDDAEHDATLRRVLQRSRELNVLFSRDKIHLKVKQVKYLGHILAADGIRPDPAKVQASRYDTTCRQERTVAISWYVDVLVNVCAKFL